jgi:hypothetical protein
VLKGDVVLSPSEALGLLSFKEEAALLAPAHEATEGLIINGPRVEPIIRSIWA